MCLQEFYPQEFGAYSSYAGNEESGAQGCGLKPICNEQKWITEWQLNCKKVLGKNICIKTPHQKQVPNMTCVLKKDAYRQCLAAASQPIPEDLIEPGDASGQDTSTQEETVTTGGGTSRKPAVAAKPINWTMISLITVLVVVLIVAIILIVRAKRAGKI